MKRMIIETGISKNAEGGFDFNFKTDNRDTDILFLNEDVSKIETDGDIDIVYAYKYNEKANRDDIKAFRQTLKLQLSDVETLYSDEVFNFVENGIFRIDRYFSLDDFNVLIGIQSTSESKALTDIMTDILEHEMKEIEHSFTLIKRMYECITIDCDKMYTVLEEAGYDERIESIIDKAMRKFEALKSQGQLYQSKKFFPKIITEAFSDYLIFENDKQRELYEKLQGANVLFCDDFYTSGSTLREANRYLKSINPDNQITAFILIKQ